MMATVSILCETGTIAVLGAFSKLRNATVSSVCLSVRLSACVEQLGSQ